MFSWPTRLLVAQKSITKWQYFLFFLLLSSSDRLRSSILREPLTVVYTGNSSILYGAVHNPIIDSIVTGATARSKLWQALFGVLTVDHAAFGALTADCIKFQLLTVNFAHILHSSFVTATKVLAGCQTSLKLCSDTPGIDEKPIKHTATVCYKKS